MDVALEIVAAARVAPVDTGDGLWCCATLNPDAPTVNLVRASMTAAEPMWCVWTALGGGQSVCTASAADATRVFLLTLRHLKDRQVTLWDRHCAVLYRGAPVAEVVPYPSPGREWHARALERELVGLLERPPLVAPRGPVPACAPAGAASSGTAAGRRPRRVGGCASVGVAQGACRPCQRVSTPPRSGGAAPGRRQGHTRSYLNVKRCIFFFTLGSVSSGSCGISPIFLCNS